MAVWMIAISFSSLDAVESDFQSNRAIPEDWMYLTEKDEMKRRHSPSEWRAGNRVFLAFLYSARRKK